MKFILLGFLLFDLIVNAEHCPLVAMTCAQCHSQNVSATPRLDFPIQNVAHLLDSKYSPINKSEASKIREFCRSRVPGSYCYSLTGNCDHLSSFFVQCPFGIVNVCKRGYGCKNTHNLSGFMTATCMPVTKTISTMLTSMKATLTTLVTKTTLTYRISTTIAGISTPIIQSLEIFPFTFPTTITVLVPYTTTIQKVCRYSSSTGKITTATRSEK